MSSLDVRCKWSINVMFCVVFLCTAHCDSLCVCQLSHLLSSSDLWKHSSHLAHNHFSF